MRAALLVDGVRATGENDTLGLEVKIGNLGGARKHLGEDIEFSQTAGDAVVGC